MKSTPTLKYPKTKPNQPNLGLASILSTSATIANQNKAVITTTVGKDSQGKQDKNVRALFSWLIAFIGVATSYKDWLWDNFSKDDKKSAPKNENQENNLPVINDQANKTYTPKKETMDLAESLPSKNVMPRSQLSFLPPTNNNQLNTQQINNNPSAIKSDSQANRVLPFPFQSLESLKVRKMQKELYLKNEELYKVKQEKDVLSVANKGLTQELAERDRFINYVKIKVDDISADSKIVFMNNIKSSPFSPFSFFRKDSSKFLNQANHQR